MTLRTWLTFGIGLGGALACGWLAFPAALYKPVDQPIQFSHKLHTGDKVGMTCEDCHALTDQGRFNLPKTETCAGCHSEVQGKTADEKRLVNDYVANNREIPWLVYARQPENVYFSHAPHLKLANLKCERCHGQHGKTDNLRPLEVDRISTYSRDIKPVAMVLGGNPPAGSMTMDDCSGCHHERGVKESCLTCHK